MLVILGQDKEDQDMSAPTAPGPHMVKDIHRTLWHALTCAICDAESDTPRAELADKLSDAISKAIEACEGLADQLGVAWNELYPEFTT
jgi:hypothetical protein